MMTAKEAWKHLAEYFRGRGKRNCGVCYELNEMLCCGVISYDVADEMLDAISLEAAKTGKSTNGFLWPMTAEGDAARVEFCERMARR